VVYDNLTPRQRLIATVEAIARDDKAEHDKLERTCPRKNYTQADYQYSGTLQGLLTMGFVVEQELTSNVLSLILAARMENAEYSDIFLQNIIDISTAWKKQMELMGIDPRAMDKIFKESRHIYVDIFMKVDLVTANEDAVKKRLETWGNYFKKVL